MFSFYYFSLCLEHNASVVLNTGTDNERASCSLSENEPLSPSNQYSVNSEEDCSELMDVKPEVMCDMLSDIKRDILTADSEFT